MRFRYALLAILFTAGCSRQEAPALRTLVLAPIENLTSDARDPSPEALQTGLWAVLQAQPDLAASVVNHRREAAGLTNAIVLTGYAAPNRFHLTVDEKPFSCRGTLADCLPVLSSEIAKALQLQPRPLPKIESLLALAKARNAPLAETAQLLEQATDTDPLFSSAWLARASHAFSQAGPAAASAVLAKAPVARMAPYEAARIKLQSADLSANQSARTAALLQLAPLVPADLSVQLQAGTAAAALRDFDAAIRIYRRTLAFGPNPAIQNELAYALAVKKDQKAAMETIGAVLAAASNDPRYLDSAGDIAFFFRDYKQAAAHYGKSAEIDATFLGGFTLYKSALAAHHAGDVAKADAAFATYLDLRAKSGDAASQPMLEALWKYRTGRKPQGLEILDKQTSPRAALFRGLALLAKHDFDAAEALARKLGAGDAASHILLALARKTPAPPGYPIPATALDAAYHHLHGDAAAAKKSVTEFRARLHPYQESAWPQLAGEQNVFPATLDDWLAFLLA